MAADTGFGYEDLRKAFANSSKRSPAVSSALIDCVRMSLEHLAELDRLEYESGVPGKSYFVFEGRLPNAYESRAINSALFDEDSSEVIRLLSAILAGELPEDPEALHAALYTGAISFPAARDTQVRGDQKSPGTFFEVFVGHLFAVALNADPTSTVTAPTLDLEISLPTDLIYDLGPNRPRIHLPVKISTRERVIQVWAHQRVLDGMHGVNRFRGILVALAETNKRKGKGNNPDSILEVCLPKQWTAYQMYIAQLFRVYYLDVPTKYRRLRDNYPFLEVKPLADFFYEKDRIVNPTEAMIELVGETEPAAAFLGLPEDDEV